MSIYYSKATKGFYDDAVHTYIPPDAVTISFEAYTALLEGQSKGKKISSDANGVPFNEEISRLTAADVWIQIKAKRTLVKDGGVLVGASWFHTDETSRAQYIGLLRMADAIMDAGGQITDVLKFNNQPIMWKAMGGNLVPMTVELIHNIFTAVSGLDFTAFAIAEIHKAAVEASIDPQSYDYNANWPASYSG